jgi:hypothetical protein
MAELREALPEARLFPVAVRPEHEPGSPEHWPGWRLELAEYTKFLLTASGVSAWLPQREAAEPAGIAEGSGARESRAGQSGAWRAKGSGEGG